MDYQRSFPFYAAYPQYPNWNQISEDQVLEDLEYLQQMYPSLAKRYQVKINEVLNRVDYDGSMIYDQYPDRWQLDRLVKSIMQAIGEEEKQNPNASGEETASAEQGMQQTWLKELITVLLYNEILRRRRKRKNYYYF